MDILNPPPLDPITCTIKQAAAASGLGEWSIWRLIRQGDLKVVRLNGRTLINVASLRNLLENGQAINPSRRGGNVLDGRGAVKVSELTGPESTP